MTGPRPLSLALLAGLILSGCGGHGSSGGKSAATSAGASSAATPAAGATPAGPVGPGSINVLALGATGGGATAATGSASAAVPSSATATPGASPATPAAGAAPVAAATNPNQPQLWGTIPTDPSTGFDGTLYLVGEKLVPGSVISVEVNGVWTKFLPATFYSSELLGVYVYLTVPADYAFTAVAPDGTQSTPVRFTVPNGGLQAVLGLNAPSVFMVYPPRLDTAFHGTLWLIGDQFMPGSVALVSAGNLPPFVMPLQFLNERTAGLLWSAPFPGDVTIQVMNPTTLTSQAFTVTVGQAAAPTGVGTAPVFAAPSQVASPFVGTVHLAGDGFLPGAWAELRTPGGATLSATPLIYISSREAWWTLAYPQPGNYEVRVVNPGNAAAAWAPFQVN